MTAMKRLNLLAFFILTWIIAGSLPTARVWAQSPNPTSAKAKKPAPKAGTAAAKPARGKTIDLLKTVDPARDTFKGTCKWESKSLELTGTGKGLESLGAVKLNAQPGNQEYRFTFEVEPSAEYIQLLVGLVSAGRQFSLDFNSRGVAISLRDVIQGLPAKNGNPIWRKDKKTVLVVEVRSDRVQIIANGEEMGVWENMDALAPSDNYGISAPDHESLSIGWVGDTGRISRLEFQVLRPGDPPLIAAGTKPAGSGNGPPKLSGRLPIPTAEQLAAAQKQVDEIFGPGLRTAKNREGAVTECKKLMSEARKIKDDPPSVYALLTAARDLACNFGDVEQAETAIYDLAARFEVDWQVERCGVFTTVAKHLSKAPEREALAVKVIDAIDDAVSQDRWNATDELVALAESQARYVKDVQQKKRLRQLLVEVKRHSRQLDEAADARRRLEVDPNDVAANLKYGEYLCFSLNDWKAGLPHLAKGSDEALAKIAGLELEALNDGIKQVALADAWWEHSEATVNRVSQAAKARAVHWYGQALPQLQGLTKLKVEKRLKQVE